MTFDRASFEADKIKFAQAISNDASLKKNGIEFIQDSDKYDYLYQWSWLGLPVLQMPEDLLSIQEIIWKHKPSVIIETGIAWGGSIVFHASIMNMYNPHGKIIGIDTVLPQKNIDLINEYIFANMIHLVHGDSSSHSIFESVKKLIQPKDHVMVILDSNHTHAHVLQELCLWSQVVTQNQFLIVSDTFVEELTQKPRRERPWSKGNNPKTAVFSFLSKNKRFTSDNFYNQRAVLSQNGGGYLLCTSASDES